MPHYNSLYAIMYTTSDYVMLQYIVCEILPSVLLIVNCIIRPPILC